MGTSGGDNSISVGDLAAILTVAGLTIYVVGLVGLAVTMRLRFARDVSTAWYVVSLLPRTVVAGQGVRIWLGWPIAITATLLCQILLLKLIRVQETIALIIVILTPLVIGLVIGSVFAYRGWKSTVPLEMTFEINPRRPGARKTFLDRLLNSVVLGSKMFGPEGIVSVTISFSKPLQVGIIAATISILGSSIMQMAGLLIMAGLDFDFASLYVMALFGDVVPPDRIALIGTIILFVGGFVVAVPAAIAIKPPLPPVQIFKASGVTTGELPDPMEGNLVTHSSDGLWYVFDNNGHLWAIPDDKVLLARIPGDMTTSPEAQGELRQDSLEEAGGEPS